MSIDDEKREHFIGLTMAEVTVVATALYKHQEQTDNFMGVRGLTRFHTSALAKIKAYCDRLIDPAGPPSSAESQLAGLLDLWSQVEHTAFLNADGSTQDWVRAYAAFEREIRRLLAGKERQGA